MARHGYTLPEPRERFARQYRRAHERWDRSPARRLERAGFGGPEGFRGAYAQRPGYRRPPAVREPARPAGSGWPAPIRELEPDAEARHFQALADRDLARAVDMELYNVIGRAADRVAVYAHDDVITLRGVVPDPRLAGSALDAAWHVPGVAEVRSRLRVRSW